MEEKIFNFNIEDIKQLGHIGQLYEIIGLQKAIDDLYHERVETAVKGLDLTPEQRKDIEQDIKLEIEDGLDVEMNVQDGNKIKDILIQTYTNYDVLQDEKTKEISFVAKPKHKRNLSTIFANAIEKHCIMMLPHLSEALPSGTIKVILRTREEVNALKDEELGAKMEIVNEQLPRMTKIAEEVMAKKEEK